MRSKVAKRILAKTPEDVRIFTRLYGDLIVRIQSILDEKKYTQKLLAEKLDKKPSEINKWLHGEHNFTLRSIAKLQAELGETLLVVPVKKQAVVYTDQNFKATCSGFTVYRTAVHGTHKTEKWNYVARKKSEINLAHAG